MAHFDQDAGVKMDQSTIALPGNPSGPSFPLPASSARTV